MDGVTSQDTNQEEPMGEWISTGKAAKLLGYSPDWFARKFEGLIPSRRQAGGHRRWLYAAVVQLQQEAP